MNRIIFQNEKAKSAKEHAIDIKRYETLSRLMDEYVFEYEESSSFPARRLKVIIAASPPRTCSNTDHPRNASGSRR